jgi:hypothetical protein
VEVLKNTGKQQTCRDVKQKAVPDDIHNTRQATARVSGKIVKGFT